MESHCLRHQGRVATKRCVSCLKPLCDECTQAYTDGIYCGDACHQQAQATQERAAKIAESDAELKEWQQKMFAFKLIGAICTFAVLFFAWDSLPSVLTDNVEKLWEAMKGLMSGGKK